MGPYVERQTTHAPVCVQDRHHFAWMDSKLQAESTKSVVSVDNDISKCDRGGKANDMELAMPSAAETLRQG
jgi:hypothetical protein